MTFSEFIEIAKGVGIVGICVRMFLAVLCGGIIGIEREYKHRPAGFRTHTLITIGATLTTLTSQFLVKQGLATDPARLGAQVIAGMGFIGAGAIIVTARRQVKGLTTAAGLWTSAIIGLAIGAGFYMGALMTVALVIVAEVLLSKLEYSVIANARSMNIYMEFRSAKDLDFIVDEMAKHNMVITEIEYTKSTAADGVHLSAVFSIRFKKKMAHENVMAMLSQIPGVVSVEEL